MGKITGRCRGCDTFAELRPSPLSSTTGLCADCLAKLRHDYVAQCTRTETRTVHPHEISDPKVRANDRKYKFLEDGRQIRVHHVASIAQAIREGTVGVDASVVVITEDNYVVEGQHRVCAILKLGRPVEMTFKILPWRWENIDDRPAIRKAVRSINRRVATSVNENLKMTTPSPAMAMMIAKYPIITFKAQGALLWSKVLRAFLGVDDIAGSGKGLHREIFEQTVHDLSFDDAERLDELLQCYLSIYPPTKSARVIYCTNPMRAGFALIEKYRRWIVKADGNCWYNVMVPPGEDQSLLRRHKESLCLYEWQKYLLDYLRAWNHGKKRDSGYRVMLP